MEPHLPHDVLYRPKMGFAVPLARWFRGPLRSACATPCWARAGRHRLVQPPYLEHLVDAHQSGARDYSAPLWTC
jgi:asparagine synthase (glutamine-hydrolysing)